MKKSIINTILENWKWFIFFPLALIVCLNFVTYMVNFWSFEGVLLQWDSLIIVSLVLILLYVVVPLSTKKGIWSLVWALVLSNLTITLVILLIIVESLRMYHPIFFLYLIPFLVILFGTICWAINYRK